MKIRFPADYEGQQCYFVFVEIVNEDKSDDTRITPEQELTVIKLGIKQEDERIIDKN